MHVTTCWTCGEPVSRDAMICPHCGRRDPVGAQAESEARAYVAVVALVLAPVVMSVLGVCRG